MTNPILHKSRKCSPISVRVTHEERSVLEKAAGGHSLSGYIRARLFQDQDHGLQEEERLSPRMRQKLLARILMQLGRSDLADNLSELTKFVRLGLLDVTPDVALLLSELRNEMRGMRRDLIKALGLRPRKDGDQ